MDKIPYTSTQALLEPGRYTVGLITDGELHLNPVHGIIHVKPAFPYLDKADKTRKHHLESIHDPGADTAGEPFLLFKHKILFIYCYCTCNCNAVSFMSADSAEDEEVAEPLHVKFARPETERSKSLREKSYSTLQKKKAEEQWIDTDYYDTNSEESQLEKNRMICEKTDYTVAILTEPKDKYIADLFGPCPEGDLVQKQLMASESMSMARIRSFPQLNDRVKNLMINGMWNIDARLV